MRLHCVLYFVALHVALALSSGVLYDEGYEVTTLYSGNKGGGGVHFHSIYTGPRDFAGYVVVDSSKSTIYTMTLPLSYKSRIDVLAGSGLHKGYKDGDADTAEFDHPQNAVVDDLGNVYVGDTRNAAIRKVKGGRVTTIAGGSRVGYVDGLGWNASFSTDIELNLDRRSCALQVVDRGNNAIRSVRLDPGCCRKPAGDSDEDSSASTHWATDLRWLAGVSVVSYVLGMVLKTWSIKAALATSCGIKDSLLALGAWCSLLLGSLGGLYARTVRLFTRQPEYPNLIDV